MANTKDVRNTALYKKALGCMVAGQIGDALGAPTESKTYRYILENFGWVDSFTGGGTDDTAAKHLLAEALIASRGYASMDDWAQVWVDQWTKIRQINATITYNTHKLRLRMLPVTVGAGSMPTSTAPMCISPVGIVNACHPRAAFAQAWDLAGLINAQETSFCRDGAAVMAATVAEAFCPGATVDSIIDASTRYLYPISGRAMREAIERALEAVERIGDYESLRREAYENPSAHLLAEFQNNPFETIPLTLALFKLAEGDIERCVLYGANLGRDADTIASMAGAIAGALHGIDAVRPEWWAQVREYSAVDQEEMAESLVRAALHKAGQESQALAALRSLA